MSADLRFILGSNYHLFLNEIRLILKQ